jgi:hypothetical protein
MISYFDAIFSAFSTLTNTTFYFTQFFHLTADLFMQEDYSFIPKICTLTQTFKVFISHEALI